MMARSLLWVTAFGLVTPTFAAAQAALYDEYTPEPAANTHDTALVEPGWVRELHERTAIPPCAGRQLGRSFLDGGLGTRLRPEGLPCRNIWDATFRLELGGFGGTIPGTGDGGMGGLSLSFGLRLHARVSVYYALMASAGRWDDDAGGTTRGFFSWNAFMFELSPAPRLGVAVGPSLDLVAGCAPSDEENVATCGYDLGYGVHTRVTLEVAEIPSGGLTLTGDAHVGWRDEREVSLVAGLGLRF